MFGNGARTGMVTTAAPHKAIPKALPAARTVFCAAAAGTALLRIAGLPTATPAAPSSASLSTVFGSCFPSKQLGYLSLLLSKKLSVLQ